MSWAGDGHAAHRYATAVSNSAQQRQQGRPRAAEKRVFFFDMPASQLVCRPMSRHGQDTRADDADIPPPPIDAALRAEAAAPYYFVVPRAAYVMARWFHGARFRRLFSIFRRDATARR